jgi:polyphosphate kinase
MGIRDSRPSATEFAGGSRRRSEPPIRPQPGRSAPGRRAAARSGAGSQDRSHLSAGRAQSGGTGDHFCWRVLYEAEDDRVPLLERLKFIAIVSANVDEFFQKRIGGLKQQVGANLHQPAHDA